MHDPTRADRGRRRAAAARADRRRRHRLPAPAAARAAKGWSRPTSRCCSRRPCSTRSARRCCPSTCARPVERVGDRARRRARGRRRRRTPGGRAVGGVGGIRARRGAGSRRAPAAGPAGAAADRDLDAVVQLFDAAARFTDRLPGETLARLHRAPRRAADPRRLAGHRRRRARGGHDPHRAREQGPRVGSRLRRPRAGGQLARPAPARLAARLRAARRRRRRPRHRRAPLAGPQLAEERRLFYVAATRARQRLVVTAVSGDEEQPSRFLDELDPVDGERPLTAAAARHPPERAGRRTARGRLRPGGRPRSIARPRPASCRGWPQAGVRGADPDEWWGLAPHVRRRAGRSTPTGRCRSARRASTRSCAASCARCCRISARATATRSRSRSARSSTRSRPTAPPDATQEDLEALLDEQWHGLDFGARWHARNERERASRDPGGAAAAGCRPAGRRPRAGRDRGGASAPRSATPC